MLSLNANPAVRARAQLLLSTSTRIISPMMQRLNQARLVGEYTDVIIDVANSIFEICSFAVHRTILAASSDYFNTMFFGPFAENGKQRLAISEVEHSTFAQILNMIYQHPVDIAALTIPEFIALQGKIKFFQLKDIIFAAGIFNVTPERIIMTYCTQRPILAVDIARILFAPTLETEEQSHAMLRHAIADDENKLAGIGGLLLKALRLNIEVMWGQISESILAQTLLFLYQQGNCSEQIYDICHFVCEVYPNISSYIPMDAFDNLDCIHGGIKNVDIRRYRERDLPKYFLPIPAMGPCIRGVVIMPRYIIPGKNYKFRPMHQYNLNGDLNGICGLSIAITDALAEILKPGTFLVLQIYSWVPSTNPLVPVNFTVLTKGNLSTEAIYHIGNTTIEETEAQYLNWIS